MARLLLTFGLATILAAGAAAAGEAPPAGPPAADDASTHRAALLVEAPDLPGKARTFPGRVDWTLRKLDGGRLAAEATVDVPGDKMEAVVTLATNVDAALPAAGTMIVRFTMQPGNTSGDVSRVSMPQMRVASDRSGRPLAGATVPITRNAFLVGLAGGDHAASNLSLLEGPRWIDIPMQLASGKIAKITFEKGDAGARILEQALASWPKP